jgi:hypothetical protein
LAGTEILLEGFVSFLDLFTKDQSAPGGGFIFRDEGRLGSIPRAGTKPERAPAGALYFLTPTSSNLQSFVVCFQQTHVCGNAARVFYSAILSCSRGGDDQHKLKRCCL